MRAYDLIRFYNLLGRMGINPIIKPKRNARIDRDLTERHRSVGFS
jgi:hypothetical protein